MLLDNQVNAVFLGCNSGQDISSCGKWLLWVNILNSFSFNSSHYYCESVIAGFCNFIYFVSIKALLSSDSKCEMPRAVCVCCINTMLYLLSFMDQMSVIFHFQFSKQKNDIISIKLHSVF